MALTGTLLLGPVGTASAQAATPGIAAQQAVSSSNGACTAGDLTAVTVVVDFQQLGAGIQVRCARGLSKGATGLDAIQAAGFTPSPVQRWGLAFICRLQGRPAADETLPVNGGYKEKCIDTPPGQAYWSYWQAPNGGSWVYSQLGVMSQKAKLGGLEGWSFSMNATASTNPTPRVSTVLPAPPAPPKTTAPRTTAPRTTAPKTIAPRTTAPGTTKPTPSTPRTTAAGSTAPKPAAPRTSAPRPSPPGATAPRAPAAGQAGSNPAGHGAAPASTAPQRTGPDASPTRQIDPATAGRTTGATRSGTGTSTASRSMVVPAAPGTTAPPTRSRVVPPARSRVTTAAVADTSAAVSPAGAGAAGAAGSTLLQLSAADPTATDVASAADVAPVAAESGGSGTITVLAAIIVVLAGAGAWLLARRRRTES